MSDKLELRKWQKDQIRRLIEQGYLILQASTGLGKGYAMSFLAKKALENNATSLILCPSHLVEDWRLKVLAWKPDAAIHVLDKKDKELHMNAVNIVSYPKFNLYNKQFQNMNKYRMVLIADEAHYLKNFRGKTYKRLLELIDHFNIKVMISATLATKSTADLFSYVHLCDSKFRQMYPDWWEFLQRGGFEFDILHLGDDKIAHKILGINESFLKREIYPKISVVTYKTAGVEENTVHIKKFKYDTTRQHEKAIEGINEIDIKDVEDNYDDYSALQVRELENIIRNPHSKMFQLSNAFVYRINDDGEKTPKHFDNKKIELVKDIVDNEKEKGHKGILFYFFIAEREALEKKLGKTAFFYEKGAGTVEQQIIEFDASDKTVFVANIKAIGEGIRFKKSSFIIEYTVHYDYAALVQGRGRLMYDGRETSYTVYTIEPKIEYMNNFRSNIMRKQRMALELLELGGIYES